MMVYKIHILNVSLRLGQISLSSSFLSSLIKKSFIKYHVIVSDYVAYSKAQATLQFYTTNNLHMRMNCKVLVKMRYA